MTSVQCIVATQSAEEGINLKNLKFGKCNGFPASFYELVQQLGRVDRSETAQTGSDKSTFTAMCIFSFE